MGRRERKTDGNRENPHKLKFKTREERNSHDHGDNLDFIFRSRADCG